MLNVFAYALSLLLTVGASAQVSGAINDESGCGLGKAQDLALRHCSDFQVGKSFLADPVILKAYKQCVLYYGLALRLQNTFCSYQTDAVIFSVTSAKAAESEEVGKANVSEAAVTKDNRKVAAINKAYMAKLAELGQRFHDAYPIYLQRLGKVNSYGARDVAREASCLSNPLGATMELNVLSATPGYLRELLAAASHGNAKITWDHMWPVLRENYVKLKQVKDEAEQNATIAEMRGIEVGKVFEETIGKSAAPVDPRIDATPTEGAITGVVQEYLTRAIKTWIPKLPAAGASIVGGGLVVAYQYNTNKKIMYPETMATFLGMLNPGLGMAANVIVAAWRTQSALQGEYRQFAHEQLKNNVNLSVAELVDFWGKKKKSEACVKAAAIEASCVQKRQANPHNPGGNCAFPPEFQQEIGRDDGGAK